MRSKFLILCFVSCFCLTGRAQEVLLFSDARSAALGCNYSLITGWWSCLSNPSGMAAEKSAGIGINYSNYYGIPETAIGSIAVSVNVKPGNLGIGLVSSGFSAINESRAVLAFARPIGKQLRAGIGINWLHYTQPYEYSDLYTWIPSIGLQWLPGKSWIIGLAFMNPAKQQYIPAGYRNLASCIVTGAGFKPSDDIQLVFELQKLNEQPVRYALGIEASLVPSFTMRLAISRQYCFMYSAGIGCSKGRIIVDASVSHQPVLGFSPFLAFNFKF